ncbi:MAG: DUF4386 domain-containing protein [Flavobacteriales bacterium]|nr:DUF4386 domain-containing protein [Bacteroidota bacterium]MCB9241940.1 DUF4386 domain-containing protein [Flavobacteriales bacterium]
MKSQKAIARTFGLFFLLAFLSYGLGTGLTTQIAEADSLRAVTDHKTQFVLGVILMALVHTIVNIGLPVLMVPVLKPFNRTLTYGYLSAGIAATVVVIVGAIFLLLYLPLGSMYTSADPSASQQYDTIGALLVKGNFYAYQIGMAIWGFGGLMFCYLLYLSRLVPRFLPIWGFLGYLVFIAGTVSELFGSNLGVQLALPGGLFEITLSIWLIVKGFNTTRLSR